MVSQVSRQLRECSAPRVDHARPSGSTAAQPPARLGYRIVGFPGDGSSVRATRRTTAARILLATHGEEIIAALSAERLNRDGDRTGELDAAGLTVAIVSRVVLALNAVGVLLTAASSECPMARRWWWGGRRCRGRRPCVDIRVDPVVDVMDASPNSWIVLPCAAPTPRRGTINGPDP